MVEHSIEERTTNWRLATGMSNDEVNVLFNDALNTLYLRLYGVGNDVTGAGLPSVYRSFLLLMGKFFFLVLFF